MDNDLLKSLSKITNEINFSHYKIVIIGGGLGGVTAGLSLYQKGHCNFTVYEQDETDSSRQQGYGLTILQGFNALKKLNVIDKVAAFDTPSRSHFIFDSSGKLINFFGSAFYAQEDGQVKKKNKFNIHIARQLLRNTLLKEIPPQYIQWNKKITNITNEGRDVIFNDGSRVENVDLIIGADGIYSQVRKLSIQDDLPLNYLGIIVVLGLCHSLHHLTKERVFQTVDGSTRLFAMPFFAPDLHANFMWQLSFPVEEDFGRFLAKNKKELREEIFKRCHNWHDPITDFFISTSDENMFGIVAYDRFIEIPLLFKFKNVVLIGDAAHPMSPFKGQGANVTLVDGNNLIEFLYKTNSIAEGMESFSKEMMTRCRSKVNESRERVKEFHDDKVLSMEYLYGNGGKEQTLMDTLQKENINSTTVDLEKEICKYFKED